MRGALWPASWGAQGRGCCGRMSDPHLVATPGKLSVSSAIAMCTVVLKAPAYTVLCNPHTNSRRAATSILIFRGNNRLKEEKQSPVTKEEPVPSSSHTPGSLQLQGPCWLSLTAVLRMETIIARFLTGTKAHSPLITDFITLETGGLGRKKIADCWSLPFQKEASWGRGGVASALTHVILPSV